MALGQSIWEQFALDPRHPANAQMRASDADREIVRSVLTEAYADGRLDQDELDERSDALTTARTLGELPPLVLDLVPDLTPVRHTAAPPPIRQGDLHEKAVAAYDRERRERLLAWLTPTLICWVIWSATMFGGFPWPAFVTIGTFLPLARLLLQRQDVIADKEEELLKRQRKQLDRERRALEQPPRPDEPGA